LFPARPRQVALQALQETIKKKWPLAGMNFKNQIKMNASKTSYYGRYPASLEEKMEMIESLYQEIQVYKALKNASKELKPYDLAQLNFEIERRAKALEEQLPQLRKNE